MATKNKIMLDCLRQLSMVYGTSVNKYAEDKLYSMIDDALEICFKERFWQRHIKKVKNFLPNTRTWKNFHNLSNICLHSIRIAHYLCSGKKSLSLLLFQTLTRVNATLLNLDFYT